MDTARFESLLSELKMPFERDQVEPDLVEYEIKIDEAEELSILGYLYTDQEDQYVRLLHFVDELAGDAPLDQLRLLMSLNGDLPVGCFCLDPEGDMIYATVSVSLEDLNTDKLSWLVESLLIAEEIYDQELGPDGDVAGEA